MPAVGLHNTVPGGTGPSSQSDDDDDNLGRRGDGTGRVMKREVCSTNRKKFHCRRPRPPSSGGCDGPPR
jgi:hypothetical protein